LTFSLVLPDEIRVLLRVSLYDFIQVMNVAWCCHIRA
jgi:hypothetical protein